MKITIIDQSVNESKVYNSRTDASKLVNVSTQTMRRWESKNKVIFHNEYIVCFNTDIIKSAGKLRKGSEKNLIRK